MRRALAVLLLFFALQVSATRVARQTLVELRDGAAAVLVVDVLDRRLRVEPQMDWTDYRVRVVEVLRGDSQRGAEMTLSFAGSDSRGIEGVPRLELQQRYLIFLDGAPLRPVPAIGWRQGIFRISGELTSLDGERVVIDGRGAISRARAHVAREGVRVSPSAIANADGTVTAQPLRHSVAEGFARAATLDDLRRFLRGEIAERRWDR